MVHYWGDEWFETHGDNLYSAISEIEKYLRKHHIGIYGKEKYGTYRDEYLRFWDGGLYQILFGYHVYIGTFVKYPYEWMTKLANKFHRFIAFEIDECSLRKNDDETWHEYAQRYERRKIKGLKHFNSKIGLTKLVQKIQAQYYNNAFQIVCKKYPDIIDELICMTDGYQMIKPNKYGNIDGTEIHNKYWTKLE